MIPDDDDEVASVETTSGGDDKVESDFKTLVADKEDAKYGSLDTEEEANEVLLLWLLWLSSLLSRCPDMK